MDMTQKPKARARPKADRPNSSRETMQVDAEVFTLVVRSVHAMAEQLPGLLRDTQELKALLWQVAENQANLQEDISAIARSVGLGRQSFRQDAAPTPSAESLRDVLRGLPNLAPVNPQGGQPNYPQSDTGYGQRPTTMRDMRVPGERR
jgi:hypothetical protein